MAQHHDEFTGAGARLVAICVDPPEANAAMVEKLRLPFPILSDPDGQGAIRPYDVWHEGKDIARPAVVVIGPDGDEHFRQVAREFADRIPEPDLVDRVRRIAEGESVDAAAVSQSAPSTTEPSPSDDAFPVEAMAPYYEGVKFTAVALRSRVGEASDEADAMESLAERYLEAYRARLS